MPLSWRLSEDELAYCIEDSGAAIVIREDEPLPEGPAHPGELDRDEREISLLLYTSGTTGRPKGVPRSHAADRAGAWSQALQHGYAWRDRTLGVMPLYHTMGIHSLLAMHLVGGCFVPQPRWDAGEALRLVAEQRITSLYLAPTLFHDLVHHPDAAVADVSSVRALGYAGAAMTSTLVRRCVDLFRPEVFVNHYGSTEIYTFAIGRDQVSKPGCAGRPAVNTRLRIDDARRDPRAPGLGRGVRGLLEAARRGCEGDAGRLVPHRRHGAPRRRRRPVAGRARRRHDRLGRREHPSARGGGRAGRAPGASTRSRSSVRRTSASASASSPSWWGRRPARSSTLTASARRSRASSAPASTGTSTRCRRAHRGRSCDGCCETRRARDGPRRIQDRAGWGGRDDHSRRPGQAQPRVDARAGPALGGVRRPRRRRRGALRRPHRRGRRLHRGRRHRRLPRALTLGRVAARPQRGGARALLEAGHRAAPGLRVRGRARARARLRLPHRCRTTCSSASPR